MRRIQKLCALALVISLLPSPTFAWNGTGHKTSAAIAFRSLKPATRDRVVAVLLKHRNISGRDTADDDDAKLDVFLKAAIFPDEIRDTGNPDHILSRPTHHFVDFPIFGSPSDRRDLRINAPNPHNDDNILKSFADNVDEVTDPNAPPDVQAVALSWIFHQVGDAHQPLHTASRFSSAFPRGDRGGNSVEFPNPRGHLKELHAFWDDLLDKSPTNLGDPIELADQIMSAHPRSALVAELGVSSRIEGWAQQSFESARQVAYGPLNANTTRFDLGDLPDDYQKKALELAKRNIALAGYRLADQLEELFGSGH
jgi:S1/P1 Nuclease